MLAYIIKTINRNGWCRNISKGKQKKFRQISGEIDLHYNLKVIIDIFQTFRGYLRSKKMLHDLKMKDWRKGIAQGRFLIVSKERLECLQGKPNLCGGV